MNKFNQIIFLVSAIFFCSLNSLGKALLYEVIDSKKVLIKSDEGRLFIGDKLLLKSADHEAGIVAIFEVTKMKEKGTLNSIYEAHLDWASNRFLVKVGDQLFPADLSSENNMYEAKTELLDRGAKDGFVSNRYRSLYTQGLGIGDTAETLTQDEFLLTWYGQLSYGIKNWLSVSSILPLNAFGGPNLQLKFRLFNSDENKIGTGINLWKVPGSTESVVNLNFMWDSMSSTSLVSHSFITLAVLTYDNSKDTTAVKSLGSSALQSGYEFLLPNWSRILVGPNYNFETKALGGYVSYLKIWDHFHFQLSLASNNLSSFRADVKDGYYLFFDAYWRY